MASRTRWTWVWVNSGSWWWTGRPGVLRFMGSQRVRHDWVTELNLTELGASQSAEWTLRWVNPPFQKPLWFLVFVFFFPEASLESDSANFYQQTQVGKSSVFSWSLDLQSCLTLYDPMDHSPTAPLSMEFSRQEYWAGLPCPPPGDVPDPGIKPVSLASPALSCGFFTIRTTWEAPNKVIIDIKCVLKSFKDYSQRPMKTT